MQWKGSTSDAWDDEPDHLTLVAYSPTSLQYGGEVDPEAVAAAANDAEKDYHYSPTSPRMRRSGCMYGALYVCYFGIGLIINNFISINFSIHFDLVHDVI